MERIVITELSKVVDGKTVYQIKRVEESGKFVALGGWVSEDTTIENGCWIDESSVVISGELKDLTLVENHSKVINSTLSASHIDYSRVVYSDLANVKVRNTSILNSEAKISDSNRNSSLRSLPLKGKQNHYSFLFVASLIMESDFTSTADSNEAENCLFEKVNMSQTIVVGKYIRITDCSNKIESVLIEGTDIVISEIGWLVKSRIKGTTIDIKSFRIVRKLTLVADKFDVYGNMLSKIEESKMRVKNSKLIGEFYLQKVEVNGGSLGLKPRLLYTEFTIMGEGINISDSLFTGDTHITGEHLIARSKFLKGLILRGTSQISEVVSSSGRPFLEGDIEIDFTILTGEEIRIMDYATIMGTKTNPITILENTVIREFATIKSTDSKRDITIQNQSICGDTKVS